MLLCISFDFKDIFTFFLGFMVALISLQQYFVNKNKLCLDLFEKRYEIFLELKNLLLKVARSEIVKLEYF